MVINLNSIILFGGRSSERHVSVASAQHLALIVPEAKLWFWDPAGSVFDVNRAELAAHQNPYDQEFKPVLAKKLSDNIEGALDQLTSEVVYLGLHGGEGENGWLQSKLEARQIAFTGSGARASKLAMDKSESKQIVKQRGILVARQLLFKPRESKVDALVKFQSEIGPIVVKPACEGSSAGLAFLREESQCRQWFQKHHDSDSPWLAEEEINGRELTVGVIMHKGMLIVLPPSEVILEKNARFDFQAKYHGVGNREVTPADLTSSQSAEAQAVSLIAHAAIGCYGYTRTDMIMTNSGFYYLETNTLPGMTKASFIPQQLRAAGIELRDFVEGQIDLARKR